MDRIGSGLVSKVQKLVQEGLEFYVNFDNLDFKILANQVLTNHRNTDVHWINQYITFDQVPSTHLDDQKPLVDLKELPLTEYLLSQGEEKKFRSNITVLAARVLTKMVPSFQENLILDAVFSLLQLQLALPAKRNEKGYGDENGLAHSRSISQPSNSIPCPVSQPGLFNHYHCKVPDSRQQAWIPEFECFETRHVAFWGYSVDSLNLWI
ncbi:hypothetical protein ACROYT_G022183 [Oculina patagonica]